MLIGIQRISLAALVLLAFGGIGNAGTTVINFDSLGLNNYDAIPGNYGSNATDTPNITVSYASYNAPDATDTVNDFLDYWNTGYGNLNSVGFATSNGLGAEIKFDAATDYQGTINSFDLAGYGSDATSTFIQIVDSSQTILWSANTLVASGSTYTSFSPALSFTGTVYLQFGTNWNVGINNISISETYVPPPAVPEPSSVISVGVAMGMLGMVVRRRRAAR